MWFDAADDASFGAGVTVATWNDRSGNNNHLVQTGLTAQPTRVGDAIGGLPAVRFDGSNDALQTATTLSNRAFHGFVVWQSPRVPPTFKSTLFGNSRNVEVNHGHSWVGARNGVSVCSGPNCYTANSGWHDARFDKGVSANTPYLWQFSFAETSTQLLATAWGGLSVTQTSLDDLPVAPATPLFVGNCDAVNCAFQGDLGEAVFFDRELTTEEATQAVTYLTHKWSLTQPSN